MAFERRAQALVCPIVVGRDDELRRLHGRVDAMVAGRGGVVAVVGDAGVGKTRLCRALREHAAELGALVLAGRAVPGASPVPYRPLTEALLAAFRSTPPPALPELEGFGGQLGRLVPDWRSEATGGADESPVLLGEAVARLLRAVGREKGCVLLLEDLHWADVETLAVVEYLHDALRDEQVLVVCTSRPGGAASDVLTNIRRLDATSIVGVAPLTSTDVERVVGACLATDAPPGDVVALVTANSEGNPFLVEELLAGLVASDALMFDGTRWWTSDQLRPTVPLNFADSIRERLRGLDDSARRVIGAAAMLGRRFDWELLPGIAELDGRAVVEGLRRGVDEQLLAVEGSEFTFRHALTREAVLTELLPPERRDLALRAWPAIERAHPGLPGPWCELAAELAEAAGDATQAALRLVESARRALASGAFTSAETIARRALRLAAGADEVTDAAEEVLVQTLALAGKPGDVARIGPALVERLARRDASIERRAGLLIVLARAGIASGDYAAAHDAISQARALEDQIGLDDATAARVDAVAAHVALELTELDDAKAFATSAIDRANATHQPAVECEALEVLGRVERTIDPGAGRAWFERSAEIAERHGLTSWLLRARQEIALEDWANGRTPAMLATRDLAARHGALVTVAVMDLSLADFALSAFDREACLEAAQRCVDASRRYGLATLSVAELWLAGAYALAGDEEAMEGAAARALERDPDDPRILGDLWGRVRAAYAIVRDDRPALRYALERQMEYARVAPVTTSIFPNRVMWALVRTIDDDDAGIAAREEISAATVLSVWPQFQAAKRLLAAVADARAGNADAATATIDEVSRELRSSYLARGTVEFHHLLVAEAALRDGWGHPVEWVRGAEAFFATAGYEAVARACRAVLSNAGVAVPRRGRGDSVVPERLRALGVTSRELDVLALVVDGLSNREIADRLSMSPKTVERHLTSLFDRTGIRNRVELGTFARPLIA